MTPERRAEIRERVNLDMARITENLRDVLIAMERQGDNEILLMGAMCSVAANMANALLVPDDRQGFIDVFSRQVRGDRL